MSWDNKANQMSCFKSSVHGLKGLGSVFLPLYRCASLIRICPFQRKVTEPQASMMTCLSQYSYGEPSGSWEGFLCECTSFGAAWTLSWTWVRHDSIIQHYHWEIMETLLKVCAADQGAQIIFWVSRLVGLCCICRTELI